MGAAAYQRGSEVNRRIISEDYESTRTARSTRTANANKVDLMQERIDQLESELTAARQQSTVLAIALANANREINRLHRFRELYVACHDVAVGFHHRIVKLSAYFRAAAPSREDQEYYKLEAQIYEPRAFEDKLPYPVELAEIHAGS